MKKKCSLFIIITILLTACSFDASNQSLSAFGDNQIDLHVLKDGLLKFEGEIMEIADFKQAFETYELSKEAVINFKVDGNATFGDVSDIQMVLREKGTLKINYKMMN